MPCKPTTVHIVSHTHWDREWYQPFQGFRRRLVALFDKLIPLLETDPEYRYFWMDGQTIVLEDYLEIRPEMEERLRKLIASGRLLVGPWYVQPDEALVSGEALIRNLVLGSRIALQWGHAAQKIGYLPDIFGHAAQTPQILRGMGMDNAFVWRGLPDKDSPSELWWEAPDGSRVLVARLHESWGYSDWQFLVRKKLSGTNLDPDELVETVRAYLEGKGARATVPVILAMDGTDHLPPDPALPQWLAILRERLPEVEFIHSTPAGYLAALRPLVQDLQVLRGEQRHYKNTGLHNMLLNGVLSSRIHLKQRNDACQTLLERWAEPAATLAAVFAGQPYPYGFLRTAWRNLLQNQPHDSICGCSIDQVHQDMLYRFDQVRMIGDETAAAALQGLAAAIAAAGAPGTRQLTLFNANPSPFEGTILVDLDLPAEPYRPHRALSDPNNYYLYVYDSGGQPVPTQLCRLQLRRLAVVRGDDGIPADCEVDRYTVALPVRVPAGGYTSYTYERRPEPKRVLGTMASGPAAWEGRYLRLSVDGNGSVNLLDKERGVEYRGLLSWEDVGDIGDGWNHYPPLHDRRVTSVGAEATVSAEYQGPLFTRVRIDWRLHVPARSAAGGTERGEETVELPITAWLDLPYDGRQVGCRIHVENTARDHALRLLFPSASQPAGLCATALGSGRQADTFYTGTVFDLTERPVQPVDTSSFGEAAEEMVPEQGLVAVCDHAGGLAILSRGLPAVNVRPDPARTIALNLLRGFPNVVWRDDEEGGQILGGHDFELAIVPFRADAGWQAQLAGEAAAFRAGLRPLLGPLTTGAGPREMSYLSVEPAGLVLSALKGAEDQPGAYVLRLYNPTAEPLAGRVRFARPPRTVWKANLNEERAEPVALAADGSIPVDAGAKKIVTFVLEW